MFSPDGARIRVQLQRIGSRRGLRAAFSGAGEARRISSGGGTFPRWRRDGKELFYVAPGNHLMSASVSENAAPRPLFTAKMAFAEFYDVSRDGQRFLISLSD